MKVLMLLDHVFPPDTRVENEIKALAFAGNEVHIACLQQQGKPLVEQTENCVIHRFPISKLVYKSSVAVLKFPMYFNFWRRIVKSLFRENRFDVIHVHDLPLAKVGLEAKSKYGCRFVLDMHENWPVLLQLSTHTNTIFGRLLSSNNQWVKYEVEMCSKADRVIVVVDEAKDRVNALGVSAEKIFVVSNTLNVEQFDPIERTDFDTRLFRMLYVGGINYHRGIQYVVKALAILKSRKIDVHFDLVGNGSYLDSIKQLIKELQVEDMVTVHGFKHFSQIVDVYESASVALIPHIKSGHTDNTIPHKIFQYLYAGIPMVVSDCNPLERIVTETNSGIVYRYDDANALAETIASLYNDRNRLYDYVKEGRKAVIERYNWAVDGKRLSEMYAGL